MIICCRFGMASVMGSISIKERIRRSENCEASSNNDDYPRNDPIPPQMITPIHIPYKSLKLRHKLSPLRLQLLQLILQPLQFLHLLQQRSLLRTDIQFNNLHLREINFIAVLAALELLFLCRELGFAFLHLFLAFFELFLLFLEIGCLLEDLFV